MHFPRHGSAAMISLIATLALLGKYQLSNSGAPETMIGSPEAANIRIPGEDIPEREELSQLDFPLDVEAAKKISKQKIFSLRFSSMQERRLQKRTGSTF